jgi:hypothetical protein
VERQSRRGGIEENDERAPLLGKERELEDKTRQ